MNILIVGLGAHPEFGLHSFKTQHYFVGVIDTLEKIPTDLVDWYAASALHNKEAIHRYVQQSGLKWDALVCWDELSVTIAHDISQLQQIPGSQMNTPYVRDKALMRKKLSEASFLSPSYFPIRSLQEAYERSRMLSWPMILKPADYGGSSGVKLIHNESEVEEAYKAAVTKSSIGTCILEEYIKGREYSVETITWSKGTHLTLGITQKDTTPPPFFVELGHIFPALLSEAEAASIVRTTQRALDVLGIERGASHTEVKLTPHGPMVIEVGGRLAGDFIPKLVWMSTKTNPYLLELSAIVGDKMPPIQKIETEIISAVTFFTSPPGVILSWPNIQQYMRKHSLEGTLQDVYYWYPSGIPAPILDSNGKRLGCGILKGSRTQVEQAYAILKQILSSSSVPQDNTAYRFPISVKGIVCQSGKVVLLKNERDEWELPGGKLEPSETPEDCVVREIEEELGLVVRVGPLVDSWIYHIYEHIDVLILSYGCYPTQVSKIICSPEHKEVGLFSLKEVEHLKMPEGYKRSIRAWLDR